MTPDQKIALVTQHGVENADLIWQAAHEVGLGYAVAVALVEGESGGRSIYGHDAGGALSTANGEVRVCGEFYDAWADIPVTPANFGVFLLKIGAGAKSNGVGPCQITYAGELPDGRSGGYFRLMLEEGLLPWEPLDNLRYGLRTFRGYMADRMASGGDYIAEVGTLYNAGNLRGGVNQYGLDLEARVEVWRARFRGEAS